MLVPPPRIALAPRFLASSHEAASDRGKIADAAELQLNAERRLGAMLVKAKAAGQVAEGPAEAGKKITVPSRNRYCGSGCATPA